MKLLQFPTCWPMNGLFVHWSRGWGVLSFSERLVCIKLNTSHLNSVCTQYVCDKSKNARVCLKWQWNALDWCYGIAPPASPVMQSSNTVSLCFTVISHTPMRSRYKVSMPPVTIKQVCCDLCLTMAAMGYSHCHGGIWVIPGNSDWRSSVPDKEPVDWLNGL